MAAKGTKEPREPRRSPVRAKRSRTEVQQEFEGIAAEVRAEQADSDPKLAEAFRGHAEELRQAAASIGIEAIVQRISGLGLEISRALADLTEKLTDEVRQLQSLREAVAIEQAELGRLHRIDVAATALDQLVEDHARRSQELEAEISARREEWADESERVERERKEQEDALRKQRQREVEEYEYKKALERRKAQDKHEEEQRQAERMKAERQQTLEKDWQAREAALKEQEEQVAALRSESAGFAAKLRTETEAAAAQARKDTESRLKQELAMAQKDAELEKRLAELRVKSMEDALAENAGRIAALEKQLADAKQQVQDIAVKAIEGASGSRALSHVNQIAIEQAKNRPQG